MLDGRQFTAGGQAALGPKGTYTEAPVNVLPPVCKMLFSKDWS